MGSPTPPSPGRQPPSQGCIHCDTSHPPGPHNCPHWNVRCEVCSRLGHRAPQCVAVNKRYPLRYRQRQRSAAVSQRSPSPSPPPSEAAHEPATRALVASVESCPPTPRVRVNVSARSDTSISCVPDTGSDVTILHSRVISLLGLRRSDLSPPPGPVYQPDGSPLTNLLGTYEVTIRMGRKEAVTTAYFMRGLASNLLSWVTCRDLKIISTSFPDQLPASVASTQAHGPMEAAHPPVPRKIPSPPPSTLLGPTQTVPPPPDLPIDSTPAVAKAWFLKHFSDVLTSKSQFMEGTHLPPMKGPPMRIHLRQDARPFAISTPRQVSLALQEGAKLELEALLRQGIIVPAGDEPSEWCHPMVVVPKPKGGVRLTMDLSKLNAQVYRPTHPSPTPFAAIRAIPAGTKYFTTLDALCGYWQLPLHEEDRHLTTFITQQGRFHFCRAPMGFSATGDEFCRRGDVALAGIPQCQKVVDDIILWDSSYRQHVTRIFDVLTRCRSHGITINSDKFVVARSESAFCGYRLSRDGVAADPEKVIAISQFPVPANITDMRSFMGLTNQLAGFSAEITTAALPLRPLLRPTNKFIWTPDHQQAFEKVKKALSSTPVLQFFDPARPTVLQTDASRLNGLGYALLQQDETDVWRLIQCGSRFLADVETRYSSIELEMKAIVYGMTKCSYYLLGTSFRLITDHRPLIPILDKYSLDQISNPRLQRLRERIAAYTFTTSWLKGSLLCLPDALSRAPVSRPTAEDLALCQELSASVRAVSVSVPSALAQDPQDLLLDHLRREADLDASYGLLVDLIVRGFPTARTAVPPALLPYWAPRDLLSVDDGLVLHGSRILIPPSCRKDVLSRLHAAHRGAESTIRRARSTVWWPAIESDIKSTVAACEQCQSLLPCQPKEPLLPTPPSTRPFENVSADFCQVGSQQWLVYHDRYSGWVEAAHFGRDTPASRAVSVISQWFAQLGVPLSIRTDNGPQFSAKSFADFLTRWGVRHETSSPHYPQSNGHAEAGVKKFKLVALKVAPSGYPSEDLARALLELRNTPSSHGLSPAQMAWGRPLRTCVPVHQSALAPVSPQVVEASIAMKTALQERQKSSYDASAKPLHPLSVGDAVRILDPLSHTWRAKGRVTRMDKKCRKYLITCTDGAGIWRNRKFIRLDRTVSFDPVPAPPSPPRPPVRSGPPPGAPHEPRRSGRPPCPKRRYDV